MPQLLLLMDDEMKNWKRFLSAFLICCSIQMITGCAGNAENNVSEKGVSADATDTPESIEETTIKNLSVEVASEGSTDSDSVENKALIDAGDRLYDRTYLSEEDGRYTYELSDKELVEKYDEIYTKAFIDVKAVSESKVEWMQKHNPDMDLDAYLKTIGYTYVDLDSDGVFEVIFGKTDGKDEHWYGDHCFSEAYTLVDTTVIMICDGGDRFIFWLGSDGYIYKIGSSGAAYSGASRLHYDSSKNIHGVRNYFCDKGLIEDEYVGYIYDPVHIMGSTDGITDSTQVPESLHITKEEMNILTDEWRARYVEIEWLKLSDYMEKYPQKFE